MVNDKFYSLPEEKQQRIINAALRIFAQNPYKKANTADIAAAAGISKGLLFHYFGNKQTLYEYLFRYGNDVMRGHISELLPPDESDFFEIWLRSQRAKSEIIMCNPYLMDFFIRVYYDKAPENVGNMSFYGDLETASTAVILDRIDRSKFREETPPEKVIRWLIWAAEGFMKRQSDLGRVDIEQLDTEFTELVLFIRQHCYKEEALQ